jgi:hypothetical protein
MKGISLLFVAVLIFSSCKKDRSRNDNFAILIDSVSINDIPVNDRGTIDSIDYKSVSVRIRFNTELDTGKFNKTRVFISQGIDTAYNYYFKDTRTLVIKPETELNDLTLYRFLFDIGPNMGGTVKDGFSFNFITRLDTTPKFPIVSDDSLLTIVQKQTFGYFWDYAHPVSGLARERLGSGDIVTSGGSGFGIMSVLTGIHRKFISREQGFERIKKIVDFLNSPDCDKFHGAFPHWLNGSTGKVQPFSQKDNGGDLVETAFLMQGLLTARQFFINGNPAEKTLCDTINKLWQNVDWDWYRNNQDKLFWHWSPSYNFEMNMPVSGWNEALIVYVLAASSPTHSITKQVYDEGWARNGAYPMKNGDVFYNIMLPVGEDYGGPLFFAHYSFLGLDPRNLVDQYANYWEQNVAHTLINYNYCVKNPKKRRGYGSNCWGLTASDIPNGYSASSPLNDLGVIAPTAAISSMPYTPEESMRALKFFYYSLGDRLWGDYGFHDAFDLTELWFADSFIAIDQGPQICMIENYRTGFLWNLFMSAAEIRKGLNVLGFTFK